MENEKGKFEIYGKDWKDEVDWQRINDCVIGFTSVYFTKADLGDDNDWILISDFVVTEEEAVKIIRNEYFNDEEEV